MTKNKTNKRSLVKSEFKTEAQKNENRKDTLKKEKTYKPDSILLYTFQILLILAIIVGCVLYTDHIGLFNPDSSNNHVERKWNSFYKMTENDTIDVIIIGNSIAFTGINPKNLSETLGATCFILAAPGTTVTDSYYCLKEALTRTKPKAVLIETRSIGDYEPDDDKQYKAHYMNNSRSFKARKNIKEKFGSMFEIFRMDEYPAVWSNTITNHDYIFNNKNQIEANKRLATELSRKNRKHGKHQAQKEKLYLGRFVRFPKGLTDSTIAIYDSLGASVDGKEENISETSKLYVNKIVSLCKENGVIPIFITLPVYYKHICNYEQKHKHLRAAIPTDCHWIDYQQDYDTTAFTPECFENTTEKNQHLSFEGSIVFSYMLAHYIHDSLKIDLPKRYLSQHWHNLFYGEEGYFFNYPSKETDTTNILLFKNLTFPSCTINDVIAIKENDKTQILVKTKKSPTNNGNNISLSVIVSMNGHKFPSLFNLSKIKGIDPIHHNIFMAYIRKDVKIESITDVRIE